MTFKFRFDFTTTPPVYYFAHIHKHLRIREYVDLFLSFSGWKIILSIPSILINAFSIERLLTEIGIFLDLIHSIV